MFRKILILMLMMIGSLSMQHPIFADGIEPNPTSHIDLASLPSQKVVVGESGKIGLQQSSPLGKYQHALSYTSSHPNLLEVTSSGEWRALGVGKVRLTIVLSESDAEFLAELKRNGDYIIEYENGLSTYSIERDIEIVPATSPVYRLYHAGLKVHLYTTDANENSVLATRGWRQEGTAWTTSNVAGEPVYRLYHAGLKVHLYTKDANEYNVLATRGWRQEGVAYRSSGTVPVYRLYHKGIKKHLYTKDVNEKTILSTRGWRYEGIAWNVE